LRKVKWGVLGVAKIATEKVIPAMQRGEACEIAAIASRDLGKAKAAADKLGIARAFGSYEELLADGDIEAVYNPLPNDLHVPWTVRALEAGKHVLCEKPIALTADEARVLLTARESSGNLVAEAFMVRFHPQWRRAKELVAAGTIGEVRAIQTYFGYRLLDPENLRNRAIGGGALYDIGCYAVLTARFIFGAEPQRVAAAIDRDPTFKTDRLTSAIVEFPGSRHLTFTVATQLSPHQRVTIVGDAGRIEIMIPFNAPPDRPTEIAIDTGADLIGGGRRIEQFPVCDQYTLQGDAFSRAIVEGKPLEFPIEDAITNMGVIDAVFRSAERGSWERPGPRPPEPGR
jgi:predicted dehydrogenase